MLVGADRCLGDIVSEMLSTIEDNDESHEEAHIYVCTLFPQFAHIFSEMKEVGVAWLDRVVGLMWFGAARCGVVRDNSGERRPCVASLFVFLRDRASSLA